MNKLLTILMTLVLLCTLSCLGTAEETTTFTWDEVANEVDNIDPDAKIVQIADWNLCMWLPSAFSEDELTQEDIDYGYISRLIDAQQTSMVAITIDESLQASLDDWLKAFVDSGYTDAEIVVINGIQALMYTDSKNDTINVMYLLVDSDQVLLFSFYPYSDENFKAIIYYMVSSLQELPQ